MQLRLTLAFLALAAAAACSQDVTPQSGTQAVTPAPAGATAQPAADAAKPAEAAPAAPAESAPAAEAAKPADAAPAAEPEKKEDEGKKAE